MQRLTRVALVMFVVACFAAAASAETIVFWHWYTADRYAYLEPLIEKFEAETGITVEAQMYPWTEMAEKLVVGLAGGVAPDVFAVSSITSAPLVFQGVYTDLRPFIENETEYDFSDLLPNALERWQTPEGMQFAFPFDLDLLALFYNKAIFDQAGMPYPTDDFTWEATLEQGKRLTVDRDGDGLPDQYGFANGHISLDTFVWAYGGELISPDYTTHGLGTPEARAGLEMFHDLSQADVNMAWGDASRFGYPHPPAAFGGGLIAMYPIGAWAPSAFWKDAATGQYTVDFDAVLIPGAEEGGKALPLEGQGLAIMSTSDKKDAAWEFIKFMVSEEVQTVSGRDLGQFPVLRSVAVSDDAFLVPGEPPANKRALIEASMYARFHPVHANWEAAWTTIRQQVSTYLAGTQALSNVIQTLDELIPGILAR